MLLLSQHVATPYGLEPTRLRSGLLLSVGDFEASKKSAVQEKISFNLPMQPAIFLDRDGTLNFDYGWITSPSKIELLPGAGEAVRAINDSGLLAVLVTNQPVIARGECTLAELDEIHKKLEALLAQSNAHLDAIYYCPHHPEAGVPGEQPEFKIRCHCRKPAPGLFESAAHDLNIDVRRSWMIGDSERDLGAAAAFGIPAALVSSNQQSFKESISSKYAFRAASVNEAVQRILGQFRQP
jgi:D-glycero-D-manno-heptose 1,7-bisphosphate phosphatase